MSFKFLMPMASFLFLNLATASPLSLPLKDATPVSQEVDRRQLYPVTPSPYPYGTPCPNEWQYLGFDPDSDATHPIIDQLHTAICSDMSQLFALIPNLVRSGNLIYSRYFPLDGDEPDSQEAIEGTYDLLWDYDNGQLQPLVASFIIDNNDFYAKVEGEKNCSVEGTFGYTGPDPNDGGTQKTHFCSLALDLPSLEDIVNRGTDVCSTLGTYPSYAIDTLSRVALHEMTHYSGVTLNGTLNGDRIVDALNVDNYPAYGPDRAFGLIDGAQDDEPGRAEINADNYAWMTLDGYWSYACTTDEPHYYNYFADPPHYEHGSEDSDE